VVSRENVCLQVKCYLSMTNSYRGRMQKSEEKPKLERQMPFRLTEALGDELEAVARANETTVQVLLRNAARALVRCHHQHGSIPLDMELVQREWRPREITSSEQLLNEAGVTVQKKNSPAKGRSPGPAIALYRTKPASAPGAASA
jgi:hypothetical protein